MRRNPKPGPMLWSNFLRPMTNVIKHTVQYSIARPRAVLRDNNVRPHTTFSCETTPPAQSCAITFPVTTTPAAPRPPPGCPHTSPDGQWVDQLRSQLRREVQRLRQPYRRPRCRSPCGAAGCTCRCARPSVASGSAERSQRELLLQLPLLALLVALDLGLVLRNNSCRGVA